MLTCPGLNKLRASFHTLMPQRHFLYGFPAFNYSFKEFTNSKELAHRDLGMGLMGFTSLVLSILFPFQEERVQRVPVKMADR